MGIHRASDMVGVGFAGPHMTADYLSDSSSGMAPSEYNSGNLELDAPTFDQPSGHAASQQNFLALLPLRDLQLSFSFGERVLHLFFLGAAVVFALALCTQGVPAQRLVNHASAQLRCRRKKASRQLLLLLLLWIAFRIGLAWLRRNHRDQTLLALAEREHPMRILLQLLGFGGFLHGPLFDRNSATLTVHVLLAISEMDIAVRTRIGIGLHHVTLPMRVSKSVSNRKERQDRVGHLLTLLHPRVTHCRKWVSDNGYVYRTSGVSEMRSIHVNTKSVNPKAPRPKPYMKLERLATRQEHTVPALRTWLNTMSSSPHEPSRGQQQPPIYSCNRNETPLYLHQNPNMTYPNQPSQGYTQRLQPMEYHYISVGGGASPSQQPLPPPSPGPVLPQDAGQYPGQYPPQVPTQFSMYAPQQQLQYQRPPMQPQALLPNYFPAYSTKHATQPPGYPTAHAKPDPYPPAAGATPTTRRSGVNADVKPVGTSGRLDSTGRGLSNQWQEPQSPVNNKHADIGAIQKKQATKSKRLDIGELLAAAAEFRSNNHDKPFIAPGSSQLHSFTRQQQHVTGLVMLDLLGRLYLSPDDWDHFPFNSSDEGKGEWMQQHGFYVCCVELPSRQAWTCRRDLQIPAESIAYWEFPKSLDRMQTHGCQARNGKPCHALQMPMKGIALPFASNNPNEYKTQYPPKWICEEFFGKLECVPKTRPQGASMPLQAPHKRGHFCTAPITSEKVSLTAQTFGNRIELTLKFLSLNGANFEGVHCAPENVKQLDHVERRGPVFGGIVATAGKSIKQRDWYRAKSIVLALRNNGDCVSATAIIPLMSIPVLRGILIDNLKTGRLLTRALYLPP
ncbi:hypothetical protein KC357_g85 [Hortaea werneckii]|nr:hypothetical protein KC357_g85 [Hortaea werneckii]